MDRYIAVYYFVYDMYIESFSTLDNAVTFLEELEEDGDGYPLFVYDRINERVAHRCNPFYENIEVGKMHNLIAKQIT